MLVLFSVMIVATQFPRDSFVVAQKHNDSHGVLNHSSCLSKCENKATPVDRALSIIGCIGSIFVIIYPGVRVSKRIVGQENLVKNRWFMAFLGIVALDYVLWSVYSFKNCYCDARIYMIISSTVGAAFSALYFLIGLVRDIGHATYPANRVTFACFFIILVIHISFADSINGYTVMIGTLIAHICRVLGTDYTRFSGAHCTVSVFGIVSGFLYFRHPHLIEEQPFRITSIAVAVVRGLEFGWWILLYMHAFFTQGVRHWYRVRELITGANT